MEGLELKVDENLPHHYLVGIGIKDMRTNNPGEIYLKYGPLYFTNHDVKRVRDAILLSRDKLFPTSITDSMENHDCTELVHSISMMKIACHANNCSMHHFSSPHKIDAEWFIEFLIKSANSSEEFRKLVMDAKISY